MSDDLFELGERIADLAARINIATHDMLTLVAEFDRREGWADTFTSCAEWLAWRTGRTLAAARENVRVAHSLAELPLTAEAMKGGRLSYTKVRTMTRVATPETEAALLRYAQSTSAARLEWLARGWKTLSRDDELAAEEVRHRSRTFSVAIDADVDVRRAGAARSGGGRRADAGDRGGRRRAVPGGGRGGPAAQPPAARRCGGAGGGAGAGGGVRGGMWGAAAVRSAIRWWSIPTPRRCASAARRDARNSTGCACARRHRGAWRATPRGSRWVTGTAKW